jgi:hypothetical protein
MSLESFALRWEGDYVYGTYISFVRHGNSPSGKTQEWEVRGTSDTIGKIAWFGRWRQYTLFPNKETTFNVRCLIEIATFLKELMDERKKKAAAIPEAIEEGT